MNVKYDYVKNVSLRQGDQEKLISTDIPQDSDLVVVSREVEKEKKVELTRDEWIEKWMEDIKQFIRNIDVSKL